MKKMPLFVGACAALFAAGAGELSLAVRGAPAAYTIVLPAGASESQKYAAEELRDYTARITGVKLPIATDASPLPSKAILLGATRHTAGVLGAPVDLAAVGEDGFRLVAKGPHLLVIARPERGTLYGVYEILERFGGCGWYSSWCEKVPRRDSLAVPDKLDDLQVPAFLMREPFWYDVLQHGDFAARIRVNSRSWRKHEAKYGGQPYRFGGGLGSCHTFEALVPIDKYGKDHPEYFAMRDGKRRNNVPPGHHLQYYVQLCLTNPDVLRIVTSNVLERIRRDPGAKFYGVSQNDNQNYCQCPACTAVDEEEDSHAGTVVRFVNAVAEAVEKEYPDVLIETLAYQFSRKPPKKTRLRHNVIPCLCSIECDFSRPISESSYPQNVSFRDDIRGWAKQTDLLYVWDYTTDFPNYPHIFPNVYALQGNVKFFRDNGVKCLFEQGAYQGRHGDFAELKAWLLAKWMWNPELPMEALLDDFFDGYYGAAAPYVRDYFEAAHRLQLMYSRDPEHPLRIFDSVHNKALPDSFLELANAAWEKAEAAVKDDPVRSYNVRMGRFGFDYTRLERMRHQCAPVLIFDPDAPALKCFAEARDLAKKQLARFNEAKDIRLAEGMPRQEAILKAWRELAAAQPPKPVTGGRGELEEKYLRQAKLGTWGDFVDDPLAGDGKALKLFNTHYEWCTSFPVSNVAFVPGVPYTVRVRVRVEAKKGAKGEAFWAGVYDPVAKRGCGDGCRPKVTETGDGYRWYDVATWIPQGEQYFWIGPGWYRKDKGESTSVEGVWIDKIEFVSADVVSK